MIGKAKNEQKTASVWVAWVCIPLLLFLNFEFYPYDFGSFDFTLFHIPAMVALTYRYGRHGFVAAIIGSAPLLFSIELDYFNFGGQVSFYLIVVHAGWLTLSKSWFAPEKSSLPHAAFMILLLIGCCISLAYNFSDNFSFGWHGTILLYYAFFVFGLRGVQIGRWLPFVGLLTFMGLVLRLVAIFNEDNSSSFNQIDDLTFNWVLDQPGEFLTMLMFLWSGKWIRTTIGTEAPSAKTLSFGFKLAMGAGILYLLEPMWQGLITAVTSLTNITSILRAVSPEGSYFLLPLLALLLPITRRNGMLIAVSLVVCYYLLSGVAALLNTDRYFYILLTDFAVAIAFAMLGKRIAQQIHGTNSAAVASFLPNAFAKKESTLQAGDWERQHDEISKTIRRVMFTLLAFSVFCGLTLASTNDASLFGVGSEIKLPIASTSIDFSSFLTVGPLILIGLIVYLHLFLQSAAELGKPQGANPLPYVFNMENPIAIIMSGFLHYWLPVLLLFQFAWKATPQPMAGFWLGLVSIGLGIVMAYLHLARMSAESKGIPRQITRIMFFAFSLLFAIQMASGGAVLKRSLMLDGAEFENRDLRGFDFTDASMKEANLENTKLSGANFSGAYLFEAIFDDANVTNVNFGEANLQGVNLEGLDLSESDLRKANITNIKFTGATLNKTDLRGAIGISCDNLIGALSLSTAYRHKDFACGEVIPDLPDEKSRGKLKSY